MGVQGRHQFHQVAFASPTTHLMTDCKEKTLRGRFIREVISIHLHRVTEEPVHRQILYQLSHKGSPLDHPICINE